MPSASRQPGPIVTVIAIVAMLLGTTAVAAGGPTAAATTPIEVAPSSAHTCGLDTDATIICWGDNVHGQSDAPSGTFLDVTVGGWFSCGIRSDGTGTCWGQNGSGQATIPTGTWTLVSGGDAHACGLRSDGTAECWGVNDYGQATAPSDAWASIDAGGSHTCGLRVDGTGACWGSNWAGQTEVPAGQWRSIDAGYDHTCGVRPDDTGECWGWNDYGQTNVPAGDWTTLSAGGRRTCGVHPDGTGECWGYLVGTAIPAGPFRDIDSGFDFACGTTTAGPVRCWGVNVNGQLGWITTPAPPDGTVGTHYATTFRSNVPGATFGVISGELPPGLTLHADGTLSGTPTTAGTYGPIRIEARSGSFPGGNRPVTIDITPAVVGSAGLSGAVTDVVTSAPLAGIIVTVTSEASPWDVLATTTTDTSGAYAVADLLPGDHRIRFFDPTGVHPRTWWGDYTAHGDATVLSLVDGEMATVNQALPQRSGKLSGRAVIGPHAAIGVAGVTVSLFDATSGHFVATATTGLQGYVLIGGLRPGTYHVAYSDPVQDRFPTQWYKLVPHPPGSMAWPVTVSSGSTTWASAWLG